MKSWAKPAGICCYRGCYEQATNSKPILAKRYVDEESTGLYIVAAPVCLKHR